MKHQIITLGRENVSVYHGLKEYKPDVVHFLITKLTADFHLPLLEMLDDNKISWKTYMVEPYNGLSVKDVCLKIQEENPDNDFLYNLSEGTKIMSFAAFEVAKKMNAKVIFLTQTGKIVDLIDFSSSQMQTPLSNLEILKLSGSRLWTYLNVKELPYADIQTAHKIKDFIESYPDMFSAIGRYYKYNCKRKIENLPQEFEVNHEIKVYIRNGRVSITRRGNPILNLQHTNSSFLMFGGRWWEAVVATQVKEWAEKHKSDSNEGLQIEAWQSVVFQANSNQRMVKNEVDILINNRNNLIFLECKSGFISQDDVYKMDSVRETYGGDSSIAALASYYPLDSVIKEKCHDLDIKTFSPNSIDEKDDFINNLPHWLDQFLRERNKVQ